MCTCMNAYDAHIDLGLNARCGRCSAAEYGNRLFVIGGYHGGKVEVFDGSNWEMRESMFILVPVHAIEDASVAALCVPRTRMRAPVSPSAFARDMHSSMRARSVIVPASTSTFYLPTHIHIRIRWPLAELLT
jgi:hypothetical protein